MCRGKEKNKIKAFGTTQMQKVEMSRLSRGNDTVVFFFFSMAAFSPQRKINNIVAETVAAFPLPLDLSKT